MLTVQVQQMQKTTGIVGTQLMPVALSSILGKVIMCGK